jgi:hypothetical protein
MPGLVPGIHEFWNCGVQGVAARHKAGHDGKAATCRLQRRRGIAIVDVADWSG